jgi:hypothetical protein
MKNRLAIFDELCRFIQYGIKCHTMSCYDNKRRNKLYY